MLSRVQRFSDHFFVQLDAFCLQLSFFAYSCAWERFCLRLELFLWQHTPFFNDMWSFFFLHRAPRLRGRTLQEGVLGTFWKPAPQKPFWEPFSEPLFCDPSDHLQKSPGPAGPKSQKSLEKSLFGGLQKSPRKYPKKSQQNLDFFGCFSTFSGIFGDFFADPQKDSFRDFFGISGPQGARRLL